MGALDSNGIYIYDETDERDTFSALLNIGQDATSDAVLADRARLDVLESAVTATPLGTPCAAADGFSLSISTGLKVGKLMFFRVSWTRTGAPITAQPDGNVADTIIATFLPGWVPIANFLYPAASVAPVASYFASSQGVWVGAVTPGQSIPTGANGQLAGVAVLA